MAKVPTASSEKDPREKHSVGLGRQVPRAVRLPGSVSLRASPPSRTDGLIIPVFQLQHPPDGRVAVFDPRANVTAADEANEEVNRYKAELGL